MRYLVLAADYVEPKLRDDPSNGGPDPWEGLSSELRDDIAQWNESYQVVVPMDLRQRTEAAAFIQDLDTRGLELALRVAVELSPAKVRYYSEGLLRYLP